jgi:hypothetical protein
MDADDLRELLDRYAAGELSPEEREAFLGVLRGGGAGPLKELELARLLEGRLPRAVTLDAPRDLHARVMRGVAAEKRPKVVIPPLRRSPLPVVLLGTGLLVALLVGAAALLPLFGVDLGLDFRGVDLPEWFTWIPAGLAACFGGGMVLRTLVRAKNDPAFRTAAKRGGGR